MTFEGSARDVDSELAERHRLGDRSAFEEIYREHAAMVYGLAHRMAGSAEQAEDLTQEVFLRVYRHLGRFRGGSSLKTWLYRVTLNHCRSRLGRKRFATQPLREEHGGDDEGATAAELTAGGRSPEEQALARDASRQVARGLREVKPVFREALVLRDLEGLSYEEIAEVLEVRIGTVRSRIARGRDQLRVALEGTR